MTEIVRNPGANPAGVDGEPKSVRDAADALLTKNGEKK